MRMRKKKNSAARLCGVSAYLLNIPAEPYREPQAAFGDFDEAFLEIGAGKGGFACEMARRNPRAAYFAMERVADCVLLAAELAARRSAERPDNLRFMNGRAEELALWFAPGTVDRIFLNFSDPWQKKGYAKRRLTYRDYLSLYFTLLRDGGSLTFKTDNLPLFEFTLSECAQVGLTPDIVTCDLHSSPYAEGNVMTEYARNFTEQGMKINMLRVTKPAGYVPPVPEDIFGAKRRQSEIEKKRETAEKD